MLSAYLPCYCNINIDINIDFTSYSILDSERNNSKMNHECIDFTNGVCIFLNFFPVCHYLLEQ